MSNCRATLESEIQLSAMNIAEKGTHNIIKRENVVIYPVQKDGDITTMKEAMTLAKKRVKEINEEFDSVRFGPSAVLNNGFTFGVGVTVAVSDNFVIHTLKQNEIASEIRVARDVQIEDAKRKGEDYEDRYLFDFDLPDTNDSTTSGPIGAKYKNFLERKKVVLEYAKHRSSVLKEMQKGDKAASKTTAAEMKVQIKKDAKIISSMERDINAMKNGSNIIDNFFRYFDKDLNAIIKMLNKVDSIENSTSKGDSLENLVLATKFLDNLRFIVDEDLTDEAFFSLGLEDIPAADKAKLKALQTKVLEVGNRVTTASNKLGAKLLEIAKTGENVKSVQENLKDLKKLLDEKDTDWASFMFLPIEDSGEILGVMRKILDDANAKKEILHLQDVLMEMKVRLEKKLGTVSSKIPRMLGGLFTKFDYSIFRRATKDGNARLVGKYSISWDKVLSEYNDRIDVLFGKSQEEGRSTAEDIAIDIERGSLFDDLNREEVDFLDIRKLPELMEDPDILESSSRLERMFGFPRGTITNQFSDGQSAVDNKSRMINNIKGANGSDSVAENEYQKMIEAQKELLYDFEISMQQLLNEHLEKDGVSVFNQLTQDSKQKIMNEYYTNSPLVFSQNYERNNHSNLLIPQSNNTSVSKNHSLQYVKIMPKKEEHFDKDFANTIESDKTLLEAWNAFSKAVEYININKKYVGEEFEKGFLDSLLDVSKGHNLEIAAQANYIVQGFRALGRGGRGLIDGLISALDLGSKAGKTATLNNRIITVDKAVSNITQKIYPILKGMKVKYGNTTYPNGRIPSSIMSILNKQLNLKTDRIDPNITLKQHIDNIVRDRIYKSGNNDMIRELVTQLNVVQAFKAKKEVETKLNYFLSLVRKAKRGESPTDKKNRIILAEEFLNSQLYDMNIRQTKKDGEETAWGIFHSNEDKLYVSMSNTAIEELNKLLEKTINIKDKARIKKDIANIQKGIDSRGTKISGNSVAEAILLRARVYAGLGYNAPSQIMNAAIGNMAGRQNDGLEWQRGNFPKAYSYTRTFKKIKPLRTKKSNDNHKLTNILLDSFNLYQNSANEIEKIVREETHGKQLGVLNPLRLVSETEKLIQKPQILAMLGDMKFVSITSADGTRTVPVFNANDHSDPHPAFELVEGVLKLRKEFIEDSSGKQTEQGGKNISTWVNRDSQEYADVFGESGKIPVIIAKINGDYRNTTTTHAKTFLPGAMVMTFKTWYPAYWKRRYGKKDGVYTKLMEEHAGAGMSAIAIKSIMFSTLVAGSAMAGPLLGGLIVMGVMGHRAYRKSMVKDVGILNHLWSKLVSLNTYQNLALGSMKFVGTTGVAIPLATTLKLAEKMLLMVTPGGKSVIPNSLIDAALMMKKGKNETEDEFRKNQDRMQFLVTEIANTLQMLLIKTLVLSMLAPDDDEAKEYSDATFLNKMRNHPDTMLYYLVENLTMRFAEDANLDVNLNGWLNLVGMNTLENMTQLIEAISRAAQGDTTISSGDNKGKNRVLHLLNKRSTPKGLQNLFGGGALSLGFDSYVKKDWTIDSFWDYDSDATVFEKGWKKARAKYKKKLEEENPLWTPEEITSEINKEHPSIKQWFLPSGKIEPGYLSKVEKYDNRRATKLHDKK